MPARPGPESAGEATAGAVRVVCPMPTPAQLRVLRALDKPKMWDNWKGRGYVRTERLRNDVMWRCVGLRLVERSPNWPNPPYWQLSEAGRAALARAQESGQ